SLGAVAKKYGVSATLLADANHLATRKVRAGQSLIIPIPSSSSSVAVSVPVEEPARVSRHGRRSSLAADAVKGKEKVGYKIRKGDTLGKIADWFDVRLTDLRRWNEISYRTPIQAGAGLNIWV